MVQLQQQSPVPPEPNKFWSRQLLTSNKSFMQHCRTRARIEQPALFCAKRSLVFSTTSLSWQFTPNKRPFMVSHPVSGRLRTSSTDDTGLQRVIVSVHEIPSGFAHRLVPWFPAGLAATDVNIALSHPWAENTGKQGFRMILEGSFFWFLTGGLHIRLIYISTTIICIYLYLNVWKNGCIMSWCT